MCSLIKGDSDSDSGQLRTALSAEAEHAVLVAGCSVAWVSYALDCLQDCVCGVYGQIERVMPGSICPAVQWRVGHSPVPSWNTDQGVQHAGESEGWAKPEGEVKAKGLLVGLLDVILGRWEPPGRNIVSSWSRADTATIEPARWDPKDGELCQSRAKPEETLVEARSDSNVQIDRQTLV